MSMAGYKDALIAANTKLGLDPKSRFIGYGLMRGRAMGTLKQVEDSRIVETPVAENLMLGLAIGLSLKGCLPVVFVERMDFVLNAMDAIVNHLDKMEEISRGEFKPAAIIRCVVGNQNKPLYTGVTHTQDLSAGVREMVSFPVVQLKTSEVIAGEYDEARQRQLSGVSTILVEYKDFV